MLFSFPIKLKSHYDYRLLNYQREEIMKMTHYLMWYALREKCPYSELFWPVFSPEYSADQSNPENGHFSSSDVNLFLKFNFLNMQRLQEQFHNHLKNKYTTGAGCSGVCTQMYPRFDFRICSVNVQWYWKS